MVEGRAAPGCYLSVDGATMAMTATVIPPFFCKLDSCSICLVHPEYPCMVWAAKKLGQILPVRCDTVPAKTMYTIHASTVQYGSVC